MLRDWLSILAGTAVPKNLDFRGAFEERERERVVTLNFKYNPLTLGSRRLVRPGEKPAIDVSGKFLTKWLGVTKLYD